MSLSARWRRLDAARWVYRLLVLQVVLLVLVAAATAIAGLVAGSPLMWVVPAALAAVSGWIAGAWQDERRWSWWVVTVLAVLSAGSGLLRLASGVTWWRPAWLAFDVVLVALLAHPGSTARLDPPRRPGRSPRWVVETPPRA